MLSGTKKHATYVHKEGSSRKINYSIAAIDGTIDGTMTEGI